MPDLDGVAATRQMAKVAPEVAARVLSMFNDDNVYDAMRAGARGYFLRGSDQGGVARAIFDVETQGGAVFGPAVASPLLARLVKPDPMQA